MLKRDMDDGFGVEIREIVKGKGMDKLWASIQVV